MSLKDRLSRNKDNDSKKEEVKKEEKSKTTPTSQQQTTTIDKDPHRELKTNVHNRLIEKLDFDVLSDPDNQSENEELKRDIKETAKEVIEEQDATISPGERRQVIQDIIDEIIGFGPINDLLEDPDV